MVILGLIAVALLAIVLLLLVKQGPVSSDKVTPSSPSRSQQEQREVCLKLIDSSSRLTNTDDALYVEKYNRIVRSWNQAGCDAYFESLPGK